MDERVLSLTARGSAVDLAGLQFLATPVAKMSGRADGAASGIGTSGMPRSGLFGALVRQQVQMRGKLSESTGNPSLPNVSAGVAGNAGTAEVEGSTGVVRPE